MTATWLVLGCGYTGTALARNLVGRPDLAADLVITRRDREAARALAATLGVRGERADLADPASLVVPAGAIGQLSSTQAPCPAPYTPVDDT